MSRDDLLSDLQNEVSARPSVAATSVAAKPAAPGPEQAAATPALDVSWTPFTWSLPSAGPARHGRGVTVRLGPFVVSLALR